MNKIVIFLVIVTSTQLYGQEITSKILTGGMWGGVHYGIRFFEGHNPYSGNFENYGYMHESNGVFTIKNNIITFIVKEGNERLNNTKMKVEINNNNLLFPVVLNAEYLEVERNFHQTYRISRIRKNLFENAQGVHYGIQTFITRTGKYIGPNTHFYAEPNLLSSKLTFTSYELSKGSETSDTIPQYETSANYGGQLYVDIIGYTNLNGRKWYLALFDSFEHVYQEEGVHPNFDKITGFKVDYGINTAWVQENELNNFGIIKDYYYYIENHIWGNAYDLWHKKKPLEYLIGLYQDVISISIVEYKVIDQNNFLVSVDIKNIYKTYSRYIVSFKTNDGIIIDSSSQEITGDFARGNVDRYIY